MTVRVSAAAALAGDRVLRDAGALGASEFAATARRFRLAHPDADVPPDAVDALARANVDAAALPWLGTAVAAYALGPWFAPRAPGAETAAAARAAAVFPAALRRAYLRESARLGWAEDPPPLYAVLRAILARALVDARPVADVELGAADLPPYARASARRAARVAALAAPAYAAALAYVPFRGIPSAGARRAVAVALPLACVAFGAAASAVLDAALGRRLLRRY